MENIREIFLEKRVYEYKGFPEILTNEDKVEVYLKFPNRFILENDNLFQLLDENDDTQENDKLIIPEEYRYLYSPLKKLNEREYYIDCNYSEHSIMIINGDSILYSCGRYSNSISIINYKFHFQELSEKYDEEELFEELYKVNYYDVELIKVCMLFGSIDEYLVEVVLNNSIDDFKQLCIVMLYSCNEARFERWLFCLEMINQKGVYNRLLNDVMKMYLEEEIIKNNPAKINSLINHLKMH